MPCWALSSPWHLHMLSAVPGACAKLTVEPSFLPDCSLPHCSLGSLSVTNLAVTNPMAKLSVTNLTAVALTTSGDVRVGGNLRVAKALTADSITANTITANRALISKGTLAVTGTSSLGTTNVGTSAKPATFTVNGASVFKGALTGGATTLASLRVTGSSLLSKVRCAPAAAPPHAVGNSLAACHATRTRCCCGT